MRNVATDSYEIVKKDKYVALIAEAMVDERGTKEFYDLPFMCMKFFEDTGFEEVHRISAPYFCRLLWFSSAWLSSIT
jgi:hypothetical protein